MIDRFSGKKWAIQWPSDRHTCAVPAVWWFDTEERRAEWIALNPGRRESVGVRNPLVKAFRNRQKEG